MQKNQPQLLKGFRDFLPEEKRSRDIVMRRIIEIFERFGFEPIETPTLEYKSTIMGKYGEEADKLVYAFKDNGDRDVAMRYDQTVPTARFIANYRDKLPFPFRRYQTQNVFRADKPQKGRYREFTQCDIDIFGSTSTIADAEILACTYFAYKNIGFPNVVLRVNDRQILFDTLTPFATEKVGVFSIIQSLDKLDKMSADDVRGELQEKGLTEKQATDCLETIRCVEPSAKLEQILREAEELGVDPTALEFSPTTARGLDYYTGMIFEIIIPGFTVGSVGGGGRYDNLINDLCGVEMPAVGVAFGFDRTVEAAIEMGLINGTQTKRVLVTLFDKESETMALAIASNLRKNGIETEVYPAVEKLGKQLKYADRKKCSFAIVIGSTERENNTVVLKDLKTGEQETIPRADVIERLLR
ncbi:histidine--tRNA ligase [Candidatus Cerribacteria bacterium 'Amazon FNV 2010 28 9']|uniref:Histidine--tRNA ligase n=1 Tax=Candidatus Cerribacteria bacterium 'Amazon FNV 2010 28 9' TaxID=2081795 RepID=A0A317JN34_9BACT|nr:MAG: histidine--tRNA ligase [Candidatus Cerribacteria bacterium 'Amazon FNV 2010 28 9']